MEVFSNDFPEEILVVEAVDIEQCLLTDKKTTVKIVAQQIWEGSNSIFSRMPDWLKNVLDFDGVDGVRDILDNFINKDVRTVIFYIPKSTIKEIRKRLKKVRSDVIYETIESYIITQSKAIESLIVYNLNDEHENIKNIFNTATLKKEFDKDSKGEEKIYLLGLRQSLSTNHEIQFYLNNTPLREEGGLILGNSPILRHKLKKGFINLFLEGEIEMEFYNTNKFTSIDPSLNEDLEDVDHGESIPIDLEDHNSPFILKSQRDNNLIFSTEIDSAFEEDDTVVPRGSAVSSILTEVNMESFFVPKNRDLKSVNFLLINKNGQKIVAGGQYHRGLIDCDIIADVVVDLEQEHFVVTNHSKEDLSFINYDNEFWKLEGEKRSEKKPQNTGYSAGIYTEILSTPSGTSLNEEIITQIRNVNRDVDEVIKGGEKHIFKLSKIDFNDSIVSFDKSGVLIQYKSLHLKEFKEELLLHRTTSKMSPTGTIIDCFVQQKPLSRGEYLHGARVYRDGSSKILGSFVSSQPIVLTHTLQGLEIDASKLIARDSNFKVQISASSNKYILEHRKKRQVVKKQDIDDLFIEVFYENIKNALIGFSVDKV